MNRLFLMIVLLGLLTVACSTASNSAAESPNKTATAAAENKAATQAKNSAPVPAQKPSESSVQGAERIKLARGESDTDLTVDLDAGETKKFVAYVTKGYMVCVRPDSDAKIATKVNGKVRDINEEGPCGDHAKASGDQVIEFTNNENKKITFVVTIGFHEHG